MEHFFPSSLPHCWLTLLREKSLTFRWSHWNLGTVLVIVISFILIKVRECIWILYITTTLDNSYYHSPLGLPRWLSGKEPICQCRRRRWYGFDPWDRKIPWRRKQQPTPVFFLENLMGRGAWWATVHGVAKRQTRLSSTRCPSRPRWLLHRGREQGEVMWTRPLVQHGQQFWASLLTVCPIISRTVPSSPQRYAEQANRRKCKGLESAYEEPKQKKSPWAVSWYGP